MMYRFIVSLTFACIQVNQLVERNNDYNELQTFAIRLLFSLTIIMSFFLSIFNAVGITDNLNSEQRGATLDRSVADLAVGGTLNEVEDLKLFGMNTDNIDNHVIFIAAQNGDVDGLKALAKNGADFSITNEEGNTLLMITTQNDNVKAVEYILSQNQDSGFGIDVNAGNKEGTTALMQAVINNNIKCTKLLLSHSGIDANVANDRGATAVTYGIMNERIEILNELRLHGADFNAVTTYGRTLLLMAATNNYTQSIKFLLDTTDQKQAISCVDERNTKNGSTALMDSSRRRDTIDAMKILLQEYNAAVNLVDNYGESALHYAVVNGNVDGIHLLLAHNAKRNMGNKDGTTALMFSSQKHDRIGVAKILLEEYDVDVDFVDNYGDSALHYSAKNGNVAGIRLLLDHNADMNMTNKNGTTPLMISCQKKDRIAAVKILLQEYNVNLVDNYGQSALHYAAANDNVDAIRLLLDHKANINMANKKGLTPLMYSIKKQHRIGAATILLKEYADVNHVDNSGHSSLHYAAARDNVDAIRLLLDHNINVNITNKYGYSAIFAAIGRGKQHVEAVKMLLEHPRIFHKKILLLRSWYL